MVNMKPVNNNAILHNNRTFAVVTEKQQNISKPDVVEHYIHKQALALGITQTCIGLLCIILQSVAIGVKALSSSSGTGIWCGIPYVISGLLGIWSSRTKSRCVIIACMVFCIVTAILFVLPLVIAAIVGFVAERLQAEPNNSKMNLNYALLGLALLEFLVTIWASIICCNGVCCGYRPQNTEVNLEGQRNASGTQQVLVVQQLQNSSIVPETQQQLQTVPVRDGGYLNLTPNNNSSSNNQHRSLPPVPSQTGDHLYMEITEETEYSLTTDYDGYLQPVESSKSVIPVLESDDGYLDMNGENSSRKDVQNHDNSLIDEGECEKTQNKKNSSYEALQQTGAYQTLC